jgi:hypothetical protein
MVSQIQLLLTLKHNSNHYHLTLQWEGTKTIIFRGFIVVNYTTTWRSKVRHFGMQHACVFSLFLDLSIVRMIDDDFIDLIRGRESFNTDAQYESFREEMIEAHERGVRPFEIYEGFNCTRNFYRSTIEWYQKGRRPLGNQPCVSAKCVEDIKAILKRGGLS